MFEDTPVLETFTGTGALSSAWQSPAYGGGNAWSRISDQAGIVTPSAEDRALYIAQQFGPDCEVIATIAVAPTGKFELVARSNLPPDTPNPFYYKLRITPPTLFELRKAVGAGTTTLIGVSQNQAVSAGDSLAIRCVGSTIEGWYKPAAGAWTLIATTTDTSLPGSGYAGIIAADATIRVDDFGARTITRTAPFAPQDFSRNTFPFALGGPAPQGGFERFLAPRLHLAYVPASVDVALGLLAEIDSPSAMAATKDAQLALLSELDSIFGIPASKNAALGLLTSSPSLLGMAPTKSALLTELIETDALLSPAALKVATLGLLSETDSLLNFAGLPINVALGLLSETDSLFAQAANRIVSLGLLSSTNSILAASALRTVTLGILAENNVLQAMTPTKAAAMGLLSEVDAPLALSSTKSALLGLLSATSSLLPVTGSRTLGLGLLAETDSLGSVTVVKPLTIVLGLLAETDQLLVYRPPRGLFLTPVDSNTLVLLEAVKLFP